MCGAENMVVFLLSDLEVGKKIDEGVSLSSDEETAQEKRLRLTKQYLAQLEEQGKCERLEDQTCGS